MTNTGLFRSPIQTRSLERSNRESTMNRFRGHITAWECDWKPLKLWSGKPKWDVQDKTEVNGISKGGLRIDSSIALIGKLVEQYNLEGKKIFHVLCTFPRRKAKVFFWKGRAFVSLRVKRKLSEVLRRSLPLHLTINTRLFSCGYFLLPPLF